jgi:Ca-activated chloride channel family protein
VGVREAFGRIAAQLSGEWRDFGVGDLQFWHRSDARLLLLALVLLAVMVLALRVAFPRRSTRRSVIVPAVLSFLPRRLSAAWTHVPLLIALVGLPFLAVALADPYTAMVHREAAYPGRRICLMIDASNSMSTPFRTQTLKTGDDSSAFLTTVAAAEKFVEMRRSGPYRDLLALVEFGSEAYVVTPFTNDYDNILVSLSLIGEPHEFASFPDQRTLIAGAIQESVQLFKAFNYLDASGNLLLIFSDGEDTNAAVKGRPLDEIISGAIEAGVPLYFVRTNYNKLEGDPAVPDKLWREAVRKTGGRFFAASDERSLLDAINQIDQVAAGTIRLTEYGTQRARFPLFAAVAAGFFVLAALSKLAVPYFQRFP